MHIGRNKLETPDPDLILYISNSHLKRVEAIRAYEQVDLNRLISHCHLRIVFCLR